MNLHYGLFTLNTIIIQLGFVFAIHLVKDGSRNVKDGVVLREPLDLKHLRYNSRSSKVFSHPKVYRCDDQGKDLVVNFVNINYPDNDINSGMCNFRLIITSPQICQVRVDFVDTEMMIPVRGDCVPQLFTIEGSVWPTGLPALCGKQHDQHLYLHLEPWILNSTFVDFKLNTTISGGKSYRFGVWLTQIDCSSFNVLKAPDGCTQYFLGETGLLKSFNYEGLEYLNGQNYQICIRPAHSVCGIRYEAKLGEFGFRKSLTGGNTVATRDTHLRSGTGAAVCGLDYLMIPNGMSVTPSIRNGRLFFKRRQPATAAPTQAPKPLPPPPPPPPPPLVFVATADRFCGGRLSSLNGDSRTQPVVARLFSNMFSLQVRTSTSSGAKYVRLNAHNGTLLGYRITYHQLRDCTWNETDLVSKPKFSNLFHSQNRPTPPGLNFREDEIEMGDSDDSGLNLLTSLMAAPNTNNSIQKSITQRPENNSVEVNTEEILDSDNLWDYLDGNWDGNGTNEGDESYDDFGEI